MVHFLCGGLVAVLLLAGWECTSAQTSPLVQQHQLKKYTCTGDIAIFPWTVRVGAAGAGEQVVDVQWGRVEKGVDHLIAIFSHGVFLPVPPYSVPRLSHFATTVAGLALSNVTANDSGLYFVEITQRHSDGTLSSLRHETMLEVIDSILLSPGLEVGVGRKAMMSPLTHQWSVSLTCGRFLYTGHSAPFDVIWTDPTGKQTPSTFYANGTFHLLLTPAHLPLTKGNYTCSLPDHVLTCRHGQAPPVGNGTVEVDGVGARLSVLEAEQGILRQELGVISVGDRDNVSKALADNQLLRQRVEALQNAQTQLTQQNSACQNHLHHLTTQADTTATTLQHLLQRIQHLEEAATTTSTTSPSTITTTNITTLDHLLHSLQTTEHQCLQQNQQQQQQNLHLTEQNQKLLRHHQAMTQQLTDAELRHTSQVTSLEDSLRELRQRCLGLNDTARSLEKELMRIREEDANVTSRVGDLETMVNSSQVTSCSGGQQVGGHHQGHDNLDLKVKMMENLMTEMSTRDRHSDVSFHVRMDNKSDVTRPIPETPLILSQEILNQGQGYDKVTGVFTAPVPGTYLFLATLAARAKGYYAQMYLMWNQAPVDLTQAYGQTNFTSGAVHAVLHLLQGDRVWLKSHSGSVYNASSTAFSGALLRLD